MKTKVTAKWPYFPLILLLMALNTSASGDTGTYDFLNDKDDYSWSFLHRVKNATVFTDEELRSVGVAGSDSRYFVRSFRNLAAYFRFTGQRADEALNIDLNDAAQRQAFETIKKYSQEEALKWAFREVNKTLATGEEFPKKELDPLILKAQHRFSDFLAPEEENGAKILNQRVESEGLFKSYRRFIVMDLYFRFDREKLKNELLPPPINTNFAGSVLDPNKYSSNEFFVVPSKGRWDIPASSGDRNDIRRETFDQALKELEQDAYSKAVRGINGDLPNSLPKENIDEFLSTYDYKEFPGKWYIQKQQIARRGEKEILHLAVFFYYDKNTLITELAPPPEKTNFAGPQINPADFASETTYVVKFDHQSFLVPVGTTQKTTFDKAILSLSRDAFRDAVVVVNKAQRNSQTEKAIAEFIQEHLENYIRGEEQRNFQIYTQNYEIRKQSAVRRFPKETLNLGVYFYFDRKALGEAIRPPLQVSPLDRNLYSDADARRVPLSSAVTLVIPFELEEVTVPQDIEDREMARRQVYTQKIETLARQALKSALSRVNADLPDAKSTQELDSLITAIGRDYRNYTLNREITHQAIKRRGSETNAEETLQLTMYFYFDRLQIKDLIQPSERAVTVELDTDDLLRMDIPASDNETYVAVFRDHEVEVPSDVQDKNAARKRAARDAVEALKLQAFNEAALDINHQLAQPMDPGEFERAVEKTAANFRHYVIDFKWIDDPQVITRGDYSTAPESLRLSLYFQVDRKALRKALVSERAITLVARYRTFVELYWNVPGKFEDFPPEMIKETTATVLENIEDFFSQKDYEIVEFENIRGELMKLLMEQEAGGIGEDDLYSQDEHTRLQSNLALRSISNWSSEGVSWKAQQGSESQFEFGKRILADYADLLIGATINSIEPSSDGRQVTLRLTVNATLFERGEWVKLASVDAARSIPYEPGSVNLIIEGGKLLAEQLAAELEPRIKHKLARRKAAEEVLTGTEQVFIVVFKGASKQQFAEIKSRLVDSNRWEYKSTDVRKRTARIAFEGSIDNFADRLEMFLSGAGLNVGLPEYVSSQRRIIFEVGQ